MYSIVSIHVVYVQFSVFKQLNQVPKNFACRGVGLHKLRRIDMCVGYLFWGELC